MYRICIIYELFAVVATAMSPWQILSNLFNNFFPLPCNWMKIKLGLKIEQFGWHAGWVVSCEQQYLSITASNPLTDQNFLTICNFFGGIQLMINWLLQDSTHLVCNIVPHTRKKVCKRQTCKSAKMVIYHQHSILHICTV